MRPTERPTQSRPVHRRPVHRRPVPIRPFRIRRWRAALLILAVPVLLSGCAAAIGVGATAGVAASQERGLGGAIDDTKIHAQILAAWVDHNPDLFGDLGAEVVEGRVLITGSVESPQAHLDAVRLAWTVEGINQVIDEVQVTDRGGVSDFARDSWITTKLRARLTFDGDIYSINYNVETVNQVVYLFGVAQNQAELGRVIRHAKDIDHVERVVSHVRIKAQPPAG